MKAETDRAVQSSFLNLPPIPCLPKQKDRQGKKNNQGQQAVKTGRNAEATIYCILKELGYTVQRQFPVGQGIYGTDLRADFYVTGIPQFPVGLIIESKWQESSGSVDEKYPYLCDNIMNHFPCPTIIVYGGGKARPEAIEYLRQRADGIKLLAALSLEEFLTWINRNL